ncbi:MAG: hypothetical protein IJ391_00830 [Clostridia bacterium]|nr:hypothetical protein [Clostridia bacterium]
MFPDYGNHYDKLDEGITVKYNAIVTKGNRVFDSTTLMLENNHYLERFELDEIEIILFEVFGDGEYEFVYKRVLNGERLAK